MVGRVHSDPEIVRLGFRAPFDAGGLFDFLAPRAVASVEEVDGGVYRRSLRLARGAGVVELEPADGHVLARFRLDDARDLDCCGAALPVAARSRLRSPAGPRCARAGPGDRPAGPRRPRPPRAGNRRSARACREGGAWAAGVTVRRGDGRGPAGRRVRAAARAPTRRGQPRVPVGRGARGRRPGDAADAARPRTRARWAVRSAGERTVRPRRPAPTAPRPAVSCSSCPVSVRGRPSTSRCARSTIPMPSCRPTSGSRRRSSRSARMAGRPPRRRWRSGGAHTAHTPRSICGGGWWRAGVGSDAPERLLACRPCQRASQACRDPEPRARRRVNSRIWE